MGIIKPPVRPAWADHAASQDSVDPGLSFSSLGWQQSEVPPARQFLNWILNYCSNGVRYFARRGLVDYDLAETYAVNDIVRGDDNCLYQSLLDANHANFPSLSPSAWGPVSLYPRTRWEVARNVTPTNLGYPTGNVMRWGVVGDGITDDAPNFARALAESRDVLVPAGVYRFSTLISVAVTGSMKTVFFMPGVTLLSSQPAEAALGILQFLGVGDGLKIVGNGVQLKYVDAPRERTSHVVYINGPSITNLEISGLDILNGPNMGIAVFGGLYGSVARGSAGACIYNCRVANTLGDGVHVEGFDADVNIYDICGENNGDDVVAVVNFTGVGAPSHHSATSRVSIKGIRSRGVKTSTVAIGGVEDFLIDDIREVADPAHSVFTIKATQATDYVIGNQRGVIDNVVTVNATKILAFDAPGASVGSIGTQYNRDIKIGKVVGYNVANQAFSFSSACPPSDALENIEIASIEMHGRSTSGSQVGYLGNVLNCRIGLLRADGFSVGLEVINCKQVSWNHVQLRSFRTSTKYAMSVIGNTLIRAGALDVDAQNCVTGVFFQSNTGVIHDGVWSVNKAQRNFRFGSNTDVLGFFDTISASLLIGAVERGGCTAIRYPRSIPEGAMYIPSVTVISIDPIGWRISEALSSEMSLCWLNNQTDIRVNYQIAVQAA